MDSPIEPPDGDWWNEQVNRRESIWLGLSGAWAVTLFGWMLGWTEFGEQNQTGSTYKLSTEKFQQKVQSYKDAAGTLTVDEEEHLVPAENDIYVGALQWDWDGLPAVLRPGETYRFHLGAYDVQHGFSVRNEANLSQQISLQILPGYEWVLEMTFDDPGTYQVVCNEFCGVGHRSMHGKFVVTDYDPAAVSTTDDDESNADYGGWFTDATGGATENYDGTTVDETGSDEVTVTVGAEGNSGSFAYDPPAVSVSSGTTVDFEWESDNHNVLVEDQPDGADWQGHESIENGGFSLQHTFETTGVYTYYCEPHLAVGMKGVVEVI
ncbi:MAG: halocyanin domain-containing protein [Halolamina sp.]|uniref:halocyanin domain-containing protein n=1 Tax=Halolamina sp. TaxID=1940283 RepID=UPI002FC3BF60